MSQGESQLHPTLKDSDGGAMIVGRGDEHYGRGRALHAGMTASERIHYGHATAADLAMLEQMRQDTIRWQQWQQPLPDNESRI